MFSCFYFFMLVNLLCIFVTPVLDTHSTRSVLWIDQSGFPARGPLVRRPFDQNHQKLHGNCKNYFLAKVVLRTCQFVGGGIIQIPGWWGVPPALLLSTRGNPAYKCMLVTPFPQNPLFLDILHEGRCPYSSSDWKSSNF